MSEKNEVTISISGVPTELVGQLETLATKNRRNRSAQIVKMLEDIVLAEEAKSRSQTPAHPHAEQHSAAA